MKDFCACAVCGIASRPTCAESSAVVDVPGVPESKEEEPSDGSEPSGLAFSTPLLSRGVAPLDRRSGNISLSRTSTSRRVRQISNSAVRMALFYTRTSRRHRMNGSSTMNLNSVLRVSPPSSTSGRSTASFVLANPRLDLWSGIQSQGSQRESCRSPLLRLSLHPVICSSSTVSATVRIVLYLITPPQRTPSLRA